MYKSKLNIKETQLAIQDLKFAFTKELNKNLNLTRVSAPLFVRTDTRINDGLSGEEPVRFFAKNIDFSHDIVHSLAKWKRTALQKYSFEKYEGLWTDMNAIRREESLDYKHSYYVDQWDWEMVIGKEDRNLEFLKSTVNKIFKSIKHVERKLNINYPLLVEKLPKEVFFISSTDLYNMFPSLSAEQREDEIAKIHKAVFIHEVGHKLPDGIPQSARAFDYDDWKLNGDLLVWDSVNNRSLEISSMGIRVDAKSLVEQSNIENKGDLWGEYHYNIAENKLPLTIGGGIGQSRLTMFLLEKKHIGEVQVSSWTDHILEECEKQGIKLL
ncbi:aspartate--ammonia ligase [Mycoplasmopsis alligatoris]|uniref:Aspartate--ammonia ligase n=1 Tax=Mycoplasmopsis alligatoris A21JP2 TaxID=747682 RepID=D4XWH2_9BACT|nr:aspartate--ammonia ligase [Mycoplasmopsis alligatoris]EFF41264.1 aspartate--ammonia ligase [Mycoplasmopsis alligatoris A21JP2]